MSVFLPLSFCSSWICCFFKSKEPDAAVIFVGTNPDANPVANPVKSVQFFLLKN